MPFCFALALLVRLGAKSPPPSGFGVGFCFSEIFAAVEPGSATLAAPTTWFLSLRMRAGICDSRVSCSFGLVCVWIWSGSEHFLLFKISVACRGLRWRPECPPLSPLDRGDLRPQRGLHWLWHPFDKWCLSCMQKCCLHNLHCEDFSELATFRHARRRACCFCSSSEC